MSESLQDGCLSYGKGRARLLKSGGDRVDLGLVIMWADYVSAMEHIDPNMPVVEHLFPGRPKLSIRSVTVTKFTREALLPEENSRSPINDAKAVLVWLETISTIGLNFILSKTPFDPLPLRFVDRVADMREKAVIEATIAWGKQRREIAKSCSFEMLERYSKTAKAWVDVDGNHPASYLLHDLIVTRATCDTLKIIPQVTKTDEYPRLEGIKNPWPLMYFFYMHPYLADRKTRFELPRITVSLREATSIIGAISAVRKREEKNVHKNDKFWFSAPAKKVMTSQENWFYRVLKSNKGMNAASLFLDPNILLSNLPRGGAYKSNEQALPELDEHALITDVFTTYYPSDGQTKGGASIMSFVNEMRGMLHEWLHPDCKVGPLTELLFSGKTDLDDLEIAQINAVRRSLYNNGLRKNDPLYGVFCSYFEQFEPIRPNIHESEN